MTRKLLITILCTSILVGASFVSQFIKQTDPLYKLFYMLPITSPRLFTAARNIDTLQEISSSMNNRGSSNVQNFVLRNQDKDSLIVDKTNHLIYYLRNGKLVTGDYWMGRKISFPLPIAIGMGGNYKTPEGEFIIDGKNVHSRFTRFLKLSAPSSGDPYGIHAGPTYLAKYYERLEKLNPFGRYVTKKDDTRGCVAVETEAMKYLFEKINIETPVLIF